MLLRNVFARGVAGGVGTGSATRFAQRSFSVTTLNSIQDHRGARKQKKRKESSSSLSEEKDLAR